MGRPRKQQQPVTEPRDEWRPALTMQQFNELERQRAREIVAAQKVEPVPSCATCAYRKWNGSYAECRRYPPPFAVVNGTDWCGEFKAKV